MTYTLASSVKIENDYLKKKALLEWYLFSYYII